MKTMNHEEGQNGPLPLAVTRQWLSRPSWFCGRSPRL